LTKVRTVRRFFSVRKFCVSKFWRAYRYSRNWLTYEKSHRKCTEHKHQR